MSVPLASPTTNSLHLQTLFLHPTTDYDIIIHLEPGAVCRTHQNVNLDAPTLARLRLSSVHANGGNEHMRIDFDPIGVLLDDLTVREILLHN